MAIESNEKVPFVRDTSEHRNNPTDYPSIAKTVVWRHIYQKMTADQFKTNMPYDTFVVWFTFILGGWKAMVSSTIEDGKYYEVTYNKQTEETYLDEYVKVENVVINYGDSKVGN